MRCENSRHSDWPFATATSGRCSSVTYSLAKGFSLVKQKSSSRRFCNVPRYAVTPRPPVTVGGRQGQPALTDMRPRGRLTTIYNARRLHHGGRQRGRGEGRTACTCSREGGHRKAWYAAKDRTRRDTMAGYLMRMSRLCSLQICTSPSVSVPALCSSAVSQARWAASLPTNTLLSSSPINNPRLHSLVTFIVLYSSTISLSLSLSTLFSLSLSLKVLAHVDSIGGSFPGFMDKFTAGLGDMGVPAGEVTCTFRSVNMKEFAMNGAPLG